MMVKLNEEKEVSYFAGIDGGGTKTTVAIANGKGEVLSIKSGGPSRLAVSPDDNLEKEIYKVLQSTLDDLQIDKNALTAVGWGAGGLDTKRDKERAENIIKKIVPQDCSRRIEDDAIIGLFSGTFGDPGLAIIAGTGSLITGINPSRERARVDGWGYLFGDLGSAYDIGRRAIMAVLESFDGRGEGTELTNLFLEELELDSPDEILDHFYPPENLPREVARLARVTDRAANLGDEVAREILDDAAGELTRSAKTLFGRLSLTKMQEIPTVLVGGVFNSTSVKEKVERNLKTLTSKVRVVRPRWPPVVGAVVAGMKEAGQEVGKGVRENLKEISVGGKNE